MRGVKRMGRQPHGSWRGALSLSLTSIITLTIALMIFSTGVYFLTSVGKKVSALEPPDSCPQQLRADVDDGLLFTICPTHLTIPAVQLARGVKIQYAITNPTRSEKNYFFERRNVNGLSIVTPYTSSDQSLSIPGHETRIDVLIIKGKASGTVYVPLTLTDSDRKEYTRTLTLTIR